MIHSSAAMAGMLSTSSGGAQGWWGAVAGSDCQTASRSRYRLGQCYAGSKPTGSSSPPRPCHLVYASHTLPLCSASPWVYKRAQQPSVFAIVGSAVETRVTVQHVSFLVHEKQKIQHENNLQHIDTETLRTVSHFNRSKVADNEHGVAPSCHIIATSASSSCLHVAL